MALRNQPYLPLYVQDFLTDEKLMMCSAATNGVYIRIMCIMHKSEKYGTILLKQNFKQTSKQVLNFASQLVKFLPYDLPTIENALEELLSEKVLFINGDFLIQKRMLKDGELSDKRSKSGGKGGKRTQQKNKETAEIFALANNKANAEYENEYKNEYEFSFEKEGLGEKTFINNSAFSVEAKNEDTQWSESIRMQHKISYDFLVQKIDEFDLYLINTQDQKKYFKDYASHFSHWLKKPTNNKNEFHKKEITDDEQKVGRMSITDAEKTFVNFANVIIPGTNGK